MTFPVDWTRVPVSGTYIDSQGNPRTGSVSFQCPTLLDSSGSVIAADTVTISLDGTGSFTYNLPSTNSSTITPTGWQWLVTEYFPGARPPFYIAIDKAVASYNMATIATALAPPQVFQYTLVSDLASTATGKGSKLVAFILRVTGAVSRWVEDKLAERWSLLDFGFVLDGVTDNNSAMLALIAACSASGTAKRVIFPAGVAALSGHYTITTPIMFIGEGQAAGADSTIPASSGSSFKYIGTAGGTFFTRSYVNRGGGFDGVDINCNGLAAMGLDDESILGARDALSIRNYTNVGWKCGAPTVTNSWNTHTSTYLDDGGYGTTGKCALWMTGTSGGGNACHNSFVNTIINHSGTMHGIYLGGCDNNSFVMTYIFRGPGGTGNGVYVDPTEISTFPVNNTFYHLEAGLGGWYQPSSTVNSPARVYGYMQDNGEPTPVLSANGSLAFDCADVVFPVTLATGTGWSGGAPTIQAWYSKNGRTVTLAIYIAGSAIVAAGNATLTGIPPNTGNQHGLGLGFGINTGGGGGTLTGYVSGSTLTIQSGISSTSSADMIFTYLVN